VSGFSAFGDGNTEVRIWLTHIQWDVTRQRPLDYCLVMWHDSAGALQDCFGHGTHVAGIAGGLTYGVAKNATLVAGAA